MNKGFTDAMKEYNSAVYNEKDIKVAFKITRCGFAGVFTTCALGFIGVPPQISAKNWHITYCILRNKKLIV